MPLTIGQFKSQFFDRAVTDSIDRGAKKALSRFGAFVWKRDKSSLRYRKKSSTPGKPPSVHRSTGFTRVRKNRKTGTETKQPASPLRELTLFAFDPLQRSVVIGAALFAKAKAGAGKAPKVIEEGGAAPFVSGGKIKAGHYAARPHLGPAFRAELPKASALFKNMIH